jgi:hypothetical protein
MVAATWAALNGPAIVWAKCSSGIVALGSCNTEATLMRLCFVLAYTCISLYTATVSGMSRLRSNPVHAAKHVRFYPCMMLPDTAAIRTIAILCKIPPQKYRFTLAFLKSFQPEGASKILYLPFWRYTSQIPVVYGVGKIQRIRQICLFHWTSKS